MAEDNNQEQSGALKLSDGPERNLTPEEELVIRRFLRNYFTIPGLIAVIVSFALGFFIERAAFQTATNQAFQSSISEIFKVIREVDAAKLRVDEAVKSTQASSAEISKSEDRARAFVNRVAAV
jgi:hypothetical protein